MPCHQPFRDDSAQLLLFKIAGCLADGSFTAGVSSFNGQTGSVILTGADVITALGCTPACDNDVVSSFNTRIGDVTLTLADVSSVADARYVLKAGDTMTGALSIGNGIQVASVPTLNLTQTWNNAAVTFTNLFSNITNTASNSNSNYFNFQMDGEDRFNFTSNGTLRAVRHDASNSGVSVFLRKRGATGDANAAVADNSLLYSISGSGFDGTTFQTGAQILSTVNGVWSGANRGNQLSITAISPGTTSAVTCLTVLGTDVVVSTSLRLPYVAKTATYTAAAGDYTIDCTANTFTIDLPTAVGITGRIYVIKNSGVGTITIDPSGAQTIDGLATQAVGAGVSFTIQSNGANWILL